MPKYAVRPFACYSLGRSVRVPGSGIAIKHLPAKVDA